MAITKKDKKHYEKVEKNLRAGSRVVVNGNTGRVLSIREYPKPKYDYKTASVRFDDRSIRTRSYSIGSLELRSHHRENLYTKITGRVISDKDLIEFCKKLKVVLKEYKDFIEYYYIQNLSKKKTAKKLGVSVKRVKNYRKNLEMAIIESDFGKFILDDLPVYLDAPIDSRIIVDSTLKFLHKKGKFTLGDIKNLERPDLFKCVASEDLVIIEDLWKELNNEV